MKIQTIRYIEQERGNDEKKKRYNPNPMMGSKQFFNMIFYMFL